MPQPTAYLSFNGNCAEAMRFYEKTLNARLHALLSIGQSPMAAHVPTEQHQRIMHAYLVLPYNGGALMAGDYMMGQSYEGMKGFSLTLNYETTAQAEGIFTALSEGGTINMPMQPAFWAKSWGMLTDRFGTPWIVNGELIPRAASV
jgi:PhnB protein